MFWTNKRKTKSKARMDCFCFVVGCILFISLPPTHAHHILSDSPCLWPPFLEKSFNIYLPSILLFTDGPYLEMCVRVQVLMYVLCVCVFCFSSVQHFITWQIVCVCVHNCVGPMYSRQQTFVLMFFVCYFGCRHMSLYNVVLDILF